MNKSYGWALVVLVLVFGIGAIVAYTRNHQRTLALPTANNLAAYTNTRYGYSFYYPPAYTVRVASEDNAIIGMATSSSFVTYAETRVATSSSAASYGEFVVSTAKQLCTTAGYACTDVAQSNPYRTETNLSGTKYYLNMMTPDGSKQRFGPVYAFNIGGNVTQSTYATLLVYRPLGATGAVEMLTAEDIAGKIEIQKVENR